MKNVKASSTLTTLVMFTTILLIASFSGETFAKRGCSAFGHACYGGHGKRSEKGDLIANEPNGKEEMQLDYELGPRSSLESQDLAREQLVNRPATRLENTLRDCSSWSMLINKLMALQERRRQYPNYVNIRK